MFPINACYDYKRIFNIFEISSLNIKAKGNQDARYKQCYRCHSSGHSSLTDWLLPNCVRCGESHLFMNCPNKDKDLKCVTSGDTHMAINRRCPKATKKKIRHTGVQRNFTLTLTEFQSLLLPIENLPMKMQLLIHCCKHSLVFSQDSQQRITSYINTPLPRRYV